VRKTLFYAVATLAFIPYAVLLGVGSLALAVHVGLAKLHAWAHREGL